MSAVVHGLAPSTTYHFRIVATNDGGTSYGSDETFTTLSYRAPTVASEAASSIGQTAATLAGTVNPDGAEVTSCVLEYGTSTSYGGSAACSPSPGSGETAVAVSAVVHGLEANTTYHFRIVATNAGGTSYGSDETFKTLPDAPTVASEAASSIGQTAATLAGTVNPDGAEVTSCVLEYGTSTSYGGSAACSPSPGSGETAVAVSAVVHGLEANTTYHFRIVATNAGGTSYGSDESFKTLPRDPPTVVSEAASSIGQTSATLAGTVNPNGGFVTSCVLEYGTSTSYTTKIPCSPSPGSGDSPVAVSAVADELEANTTYHFRIVAANHAGTSYGSDETFTTLHHDPPTVLSEPASSVGQTSATLNATVNPHGGEVTECELEYGTSVFYTSSAPCSPSPGSGKTPVAVSAVVGELEPNTTYHFRITATNDGGTSYGYDESFTTLHHDPPTVVSEAASSIDETSASLNATVNPHGGEVSECYFEYGETESYTNIESCSSSPGSGKTPVAVSAVAYGLDPNTTYHYRIVATNDGGTSYGSDQTFTTLVDAPAVLTETASALGRTSATLNATVNPDGVTVSECEFEYGTSEQYGASAPCSSLPGSGESPVAVSAAVIDLEPNTVYHYRIVARNAGGTGYGSDQTFTTLPEVPSVVTEPASSRGRTSASLNATVNPGGVTVSECEFEYGTSEQYGARVPCSSLPGSGSSPVAVSAAVSKLSVETVYHYRIVARNAGGTSYGTDQTFKTLSKPPSVVTGKVSVRSQTSATLPATVNPNGEEVSECQFEYGTSELYGASVPCSSLPGSGESPVAVSAAVIDLEPNTLYYYRILATNPGGTSYGSDKVFMTLPRPLDVVTEAAFPFSQTTATLNASVNPDASPVTECYFEYGTSAQYGSPPVQCSSLPAGSNPVAVSAAVSGLEPNTLYHYRIVARNADGLSYGDDATFTTLPDAPADVTEAASVLGQTSATLNATVNPEGGEVSECYFEYGETAGVYMGFVPAPCMSLPGSGDSPVAVSAMVGGLEPNTTYHYRIVAANAGGLSYGGDETFTTLPSEAPRRQ